MDLNIILLIGLVATLVLNYFARKKAYLEGVVFGAEETLGKLVQHKIITVDDVGTIARITAQEMEEEDSY